MCDSSGLLTTAWFTWDSGMLSTILHGKEPFQNKAGAADGQPRLEALSCPAGVLPLAQIIKYLF